MTFRALPPQLHGTAEAVVRFFLDDRGTKLAAEEPVSVDLDYRPTLKGSTPEHHDVWVEVSEVPYLNSLDTIVLYCMRECLPVKLYVAFPSGPVGDYKKLVDEAKRNGVGVLEVHPLSLNGVRSEKRTLFPPRFRSPLSTAESTFRNGDAGKGCALVYDEIEDLSRRLAKRIQSNGWWTNPTTPPTINPTTGNWGPLMDVLLDRTAFAHLPQGLRNRRILLRVAALTGHRNESGHKPGNRAALIRRDRELRTRYESALDLLRDFAAACRPLHL